MVSIKIYIFLRFSRKIYEIAFGDGKLSWFRIRLIFLNQDNLRLLQNQFYYRNFHVRLAHRQFQRQVAFISATHLHFRTIIQ